MKRRFEFIGGTSKKFWVIQEPLANKAGGWIVNVHFGRIGTEGQTHYNVFWSADNAHSHYQRKIAEKLGKGYKEIVEGPTITKAGLATAKAIANAINSPKPEKACEHLQLRKTGDRKWECNSCKTHIEFDKPQNKIEVEMEVTQVRRFIDLSALRG